MTEYSNGIKSIYDDGNIPEIDLPKEAWVTEPSPGEPVIQPLPDQPKESWITEPLPESTRPRKDGPGGDGNDQ
ncbi:MAG: hypothetical protein ACOYBE_06680 [Blautia sp.]|jgi:hypothetical protein